MKPYYCTWEHINHGAFWEIRMCAGTIKTARFDDEPLVYTKCRHCGKTIKAVYR